ncbi:TonB-dependent hemoglobin/transferrin/lactoferrin family receptor [Pseudoxanthomonas sp. Root630]|uniref:TonB-dependent hemoglobin/transferrin/lactoferrin family receptor n=1 Tax=Pseudoxanthomonas sp. Root630 TaxID=1736574 RepID=UPI000703A305|nr:TonB-dependent hemoglobin/transferrin/lactoferrin family receptor [Pseudoxanthomonas sp. Root630]KRA46974.1 sugar transporter [Pseudoxanthomonas sp. Root630]
MMRPTLLTAAVWLALAGHAHAETPADTSASASADTSTREFERIQVTATRTERAVADVPNTVDVIEREQLDDQLIRDIKDLVRYEPGVSVTSTTGRFGALGGFRIRGLDANRVLILNDGVAISDSFSFGSYLNANRNFVDLDTLKRVEIVRGPASSLYGSDALGGVVAFVTKDPSDYLKDGKDTYFGVKFGYEGDWQGLFAGATAAFGGERWSGLVAASHRQGKETETQGDNDSTTPTRLENGTFTVLRTAANPQRRDGRSLLAKLVYAPGENQRLRLTVDANEDYSSIEAYTGRTTTLLDMDGRDHQTRARVSLEHEIDVLDAGFADSLAWKLYRQDSESTQRTIESRATATNGPATSRRVMLHNFDQRMYGLQGNLYKAFETGSVRHALTYGLDVSVTDSKEKRDGTSTNLATGVVSNLVGQDRFPVRDFPISETTKIGAYVQDEMQFADGRFSLVPALRVDYYKLDPTLDNIFAEDNPGVAVEGMNETSVSPKLGGIWRMNDQWSLFANYARGFRAPPYGDVNVGFTNLQGGYTVIANPDLKPETSNGYELGVRFAGDAFYAGLTGYYNDYKDFIESFVLVSMPPQTPLMIFQSQNVADARIYGLEFKGGVDFGALNPALEGLSLRAAVAHSRGDDKTDDVPLNSVDPLRATLGLAYDGKGWGTELVGSFADRKDRPPSASTYRPAGYGVLDLYAHWEFAPGAKINLGLINLTDKTYTDWADVNGVAANSLVLDRYTRPGRTLSASLAVSW